MNQLIPFKKDIIFKTKINDITSISLEHNIQIKDRTVFLEFIISGDYKMTEASTIKENFEYKLPFEINIDEKYDISKIDVDIDDFYYEVINNEILRINISVLLDNLTINKNNEVKIEEIKLNEFSSDIKNSILDLEENEDEEDEIIFNDERKEDNKMLEEENTIIEENNKVEESDNKEIINSLFNNIVDEETFKTYHVYIMREEDTLESVLIKYNVTKETLEEYNNLDNIKIGDKIIIPNID